MRYVAAEESRCRRTLNVLRSTFYVLRFTSNVIPYCANEILTCTPALVFTSGAELDIYGLTLR